MCLITPRVDAAVSLFGPVSPNPNIPSTETGNKAIGYVPWFLGHQNLLHLRIVEWGVEKGKSKYFGTTECLLNQERPSSLFRHNNNLVTNLWLDMRKRRQPRGSRSNPHADDDESLMDTSDEMPGQTPDQPR